jgi:D-glycero-D-manno-heptose 1,7-bisphosphate phosphatase
MQKAVFLDRDGVLNEERGEYTYKIEDFIIPKGVTEALKILKEKGFLLIVITNQGGIAKGAYTAQDVLNCHLYLQQQCGYLIDDLYYSPYNEVYSNSLSRKPDSLMLERAIAKYNISAHNSWMIGDSLRDIIPAKKLGIRTVKIGEKVDYFVDIYAENLWDATHKILSE